MRLLSQILINFEFLFYSEAIECVLSDSQKSYKHAIELKCWLEGVYVDRNLLNGTYGLDVISSGVGSNKKGYKPDYIQQSFYQWVVPVLLLQALLLYVPRVLWHICEGGLMNKLLDNAGEFVMEGSLRNIFLSVFIFRCIDS